MILREAPRWRPLVVAAMLALAAAQDPPAGGETTNSTTTTTTTTTTAMRFPNCPIDPLAPTDLIDPPTFAQDCTQCDDVLEHEWLACVACDASNKYAQYTGYDGLIGSTKSKTYCRGGNPCNIFTMNGFYYADMDGVYLRDNNRVFPPDADKPSYWNANGLYYLYYCLEFNKWMLAPATDWERNVESPTACYRLAEKSGSDNVGVHPERHQWFQYVDRYIEEDTAIWKNGWGRAAIAQRCQAVPSSAQASATFVAVLIAMWLR
mmetsp:Transcript_47164/g.102668  ORF Transcript_47164/g.102668 Transcript_47164/m.102668 type:complete len:263 (+) Transcript_47164:52-840(+)